MTKERFEEIYQHTLKWEGGEKLHKISGDSGGWTKYGIAYNFNKQHFNSLEDFKAMSYERACEIAFENYCEPLNLALVPDEAQAYFFDMAFNMGVKRAIILAQRALNIEDDGVIGKQTKEALKGLNKSDLHVQRVRFYNAIVEGNPTQKKFLKGWINRSNYFLNTDI